MAKVLFHRVFVNLSEGSPRDSLETEHLARGTRFFLSYFCQAGELLGARDKKAAGDGITG